MVQAILIPTDGSSTSNRAVMGGLGLAARLQARALLVHVPETGVYAAAAREEARAYGAALLAFWQREAARRGIAASTHLLEGAVADVIVGGARALGSDLIVMGTHGRHGAPPHLVGSVAERVTRLSPCPVLLLRGPAVPEAWVVHPERLPEELPSWAAEGWASGGAAPSFRRVLAALDGRASGWRALGQAAGLARALGAQLYLLHVIDSALTPGSPRTRAADLDLLRQTVRRSGRQVLEEAQARVSDLPVTPLLYEARGHRVGEAVARAASDVGADLIVLGTHNRQGLERWLLGSVSALVTHLAACPLLLVPPATGAGERPLAGRAPAAPPEDGRVGG